MCFCLPSPARKLVWGPPWFSLDKGSAFKGPRPLGGIPLRGFASHLGYRQAREGESSSDYPILQGCTVSRIQGPPHYAMLTLRRGAKNSPATHPLKYLPPWGLSFAFIYCSSSGVYRTRRRIWANSTSQGSGCLPSPTSKMPREAGSISARSAPTW